jgi:hypothetical protein
MMRHAIARRSAMAPMRMPSTDDAVSQHAIQVDVVLDHVGGDLRQCGVELRLRSTPSMWPLWRDGRRVYQPW